jgi:hypothetical protein
MNPKNLSATVLWVGLLAGAALSGCTTPNSTNSASTAAACPPTATVASAPTPTATAVTNALLPRARWSNEEFRREQYPVDGRGFSPVDKNIAKVGKVKDDEEGSLNPYVLAMLACYPTNGSYPYRCKPLEYDLYNGVTQDIWYKARVVAKAHPNWTRCSYCCGLTFEVFCRAMQYRNVQKGLDPDDFNGMSYYDLFNLLQFWYIEAAGDSPQLGIVSYGLGKKIDKLEDARPGDFLDFSRNNKSGHSVIFIDWVKDEGGKIVGFKYFSSNSGGVGYGTERFEDCGGKVLHRYFRLARVGSVENYQKFDRTRIAFHRAYAP